MIVSNLNDRRVNDVLNSGGVAVIPTDTIYGLVARAFDETAVLKVSKLRRRPAGKSYIILCASEDEMPEFGVPIKLAQAVAKRFWPGPISVVLPVDQTRFAYLHGTAEDLAFRVPRSSARLRRLLEATGPLVAPSANIDGRPAARTIAEARAYFGNKADIYVDAGPLDSPPSTLIKVADDGAITVLRPGADSTYRVLA